MFFLLPPIFLPLSACFVLLVSLPSISDFPLLPYNTPFFPPPLHTSQSHSISHPPFPPHPKSLSPLLSSLFSIFPFPITTYRQCCYPASPSCFQSPHPFLQASFPVPGIPSFPSALILLHLPLSPSLSSSTTTFLPHLSVSSAHFPPPPLLPRLSSSPRFHPFPLQLPVMALDWMVGEPE